MPVPETPRQGGGKMKWKMGNRLVLAGFGIATAILVSVGWQSYRNTARFAEAAQWREHTYEVLNSLDNAVDRLSDAETGQRGYLLTGEEAYLEPYRAAIKNIDQTIGDLKNLTSDNPNQQKHIQILEPLVEEKLAELQMTIDLRRSEGFAAANRVVLEGSGKQWMDQIRAIIAEMANEEKDLLKIRTQEANESVAKSVRTILAGTLVSISLLVLCFGLLNRELSERKRAQEALSKSEKWLSTTLSSIGDAVIATDMNGGVTFLNPVAQSLTGWSLEEARGKSMDMVFDIVNAETRRPVENPVKKVFREGKIVGLADHTLLLSRGGREFHIEDSAAPILTDTGEGFGVVLVFRDITEQKQAEEALKANELRLNLALDAAQLGIWELDLVNDKAYRNLRHDQIFGFESLQPDWGQEIFLTRVVPEDREAVKQSFEKAFATGDFSMECRIIREDKSIHWIFAQGRVFRNDKGDAVRMMGTLADVTERKRGEEAIVRAKEEAERVSKFKDQFLSTMSHELRTPLNAVLGFSDLLADERYGPLNDRQRRYVSHIHTGGKHLLKLISDILDLSKIEAGKMELTRENVSIASAFGEVLSALQPLADKKSQALRQKVETGLQVRADAMRFKQVLTNLVGNAIKFTPEGGRIELAARQENDQVRIEVRDNGPGIPPEQREQIFEAFFRLAQTGTATEGTGLGLAITARLVELHGSKLEIESQPEEGACFYFSLPLIAITPDEPSQTTIATPRADKAPRILVIEDNAATGQLIQSQLTSSGYDTLRCDQPERATEMAAEHRPDAITLDLLMQPVHGLEVLLQLKNDPRTSKIPVIVVTIVDQPGVGTALGADEYLVKPVDKATLLAAVERCLNSRGGVAPARPILVVEDDASTREMIEELLTTRGYSVITAADGAQARARVAHALPELVILDLVLPRMSGFELLAEWRGSPRTADLPVFVLTSKDLTKEEEKYVRAHAESLFRKQHSWREPLMKQLERVVTSQILEDA
jgi:PAS domain S-box-containing protein